MRNILKLPDIGEQVAAMRLSDLPDSGAFDAINLVLKKMEHGDRVISLAVGEPTYDTPADIIEAAYSGLKLGKTHYTSASGIPSVREAIATKVRRKNRIECSPDNCAFMTTKMAIYAAFMSVGGSDRNEILLPNPGFFYTEPALLAGLEVRYYGTADGVAPDIEKLKSSINARTAAVVLNDPCNPTGKVLERSEVEEIYNECVSSGAKLISDEAYEDLVYEKEHISAGSLEKETETVISLFSLSKSYSMTGWRAGYVVAPHDVLRDMVRLVEHTYTCSPPFIQLASEYALNHCESHIQRFREEFRMKRDFVQKRLKGIEGLKSGTIDGAFYAFPSYDFDMKSVEFCRQFLEEHHVAVLPGSAFGTEGENHLRISFSGNLEDIGHGLDELEKFISGRT